VAIAGPNGAGKTTLLNLVSGFIKPDSGKVFFKGKDITGYPPHKTAELGIARTFQIPRPLHHLPTILNVVISLLSPRIKKLTGGLGDELVRALDILEEVGFERDSEYIQRPAGLLPHGYLKRVELLFLDELLSGLSRPEVTSILPLITKLRETGFTLLMVEHRVGDVATVADRIIVLHRGEKIAEGKPEKVLSDERVRSSVIISKEVVH